MKLDYLELTNFRCFNQFRIDFDPRLTVLIAPNGAGKTAALDAIAVNLGAFVSRFPDVSGVGPRDTDHRENDDGSKPPYMRIRTRLTNDIAWDRTEKRDSTAKTKKEIPPSLKFKPLYNFADQFIDAENERQPYNLPIIVYYGTGRGVFEIPKRRRGFKKQFKRFDAYDGALQARANFKRFFEWFYFMEDMERRGKEEAQDWNYRQPELNAMREAIRRATPEFSNPRSELSPLRLVVDWKRNSHGQTLRIDQLSDGYRTTLAMVMDIASRMAEANPHEDDILATEGVVMIDEIEMHLHPAWQQTVLPDLQRTFPNLQFIISTHSPQVISTVPADNIRIIENGIVYTPSAGTKGAEASRILKRVFGVDLRPKDDPNVVLLNEYLSMVYQDQWDSREAENKRRKLDEIYQGEEPALTEADLYIENRKWELADEADI